MKQENRANQPSCNESTSSPQRPKRSTGSKSLDNSNGLLWTEEKELKRALYASLQESRKVPTVAEEAGKTMAKNDTRQGQLAASKHANSREASPKRTRVHAQRKFAQGSTPNSPLPTPVKVSSMNNVATDLFPSRRPKTEDFLTFLCLRGTPILPKGLDFLNSYTRGISDSEGEPELESDVEDGGSSHRGQYGVKPGELKGKLNGLSSSLENGNIPRKNLAKSLTPKKKGDKESSTGVSPVSSEGAPPVNNQQHCKLENGTFTSCKRKSAPEQEEPSKKKRLSSTAKGNSATATTNDAPKNSSVEALKEKYKQQRLAKKIQLTKPQKEAPKSKPPPPPPPPPPPKKKEKAKPTKPVEATATSKSKRKLPPKTKPDPKPKQTFTKVSKRVLRSRKSLRSSTRRRTIPLGVMPHLRKAKLVPPVVDFDSESDLESECSSVESEELKPPPPPAKASKKEVGSKAQSVAKSANSKSSDKPKGKNSGKAGSSLPPPSKRPNHAQTSISKSSKKAKSDSKKKNASSSSNKKLPEETDDEDSEDDLPVRLTRSAKAKEISAQVSNAPVKKSKPSSSKKKSSGKKKHASSSKKSDKTTSENATNSEEKKLDKSSDEKKSSQKKSEKQASKKSNKKAGNSKLSKKDKSSGKKLASSEKHRDKLLKKKGKSSGKTGKSDLKEKKSDSTDHQKTKKHKAKLQKLLEELDEDIGESDTPLSVVSARKLHEKNSKSADGSSSTSKSVPKDPDKKDSSKKSKNPAKSSGKTDCSDSSAPLKKDGGKNASHSSKPSKTFFKSSSSEKISSKSKDSSPLKKFGKSSSTTDISTKDDLPLSFLAKKQLVYDQFDFSDSSDSLSDFLPLKKKRKTIGDEQPLKEKAKGLPDKVQNAKILSGSDSDDNAFRESLVSSAKSLSAVSKKVSGSKLLSDSSSPSKKVKQQGNKEKSKVVSKEKTKKEAISSNNKDLAPSENEESKDKQVPTDKQPQTPCKQVPAAEPSDDTKRPISPPPLSVPPDCPPDYVEAASYMVQEMSEEVPGLESVSDEAARTLPSDLVFGTPEDIHGLMTSEFSGVFDEAFTTGAILLTTRDTLAQIPLNFLHELTPTKTVVDAATNTCEEDIISCTTETPSKNDETSVGTQTMTPVASPAPPILESAVLTAPKTPSTPPPSCSRSSSTPSQSSPLPKQKQKSPKTTLPLATFASKKRTKLLKKAKEQTEPFPSPTDTPRVAEAPVYHPSAEEFQDPLEFIKKIQPEAEKYGICKIVPPSSFKPECKVNDDMRFTAHNQYVHKMLYRWGPNVQHLACIRKHLKSQGVSLEQSPLIGGIELDLSKFYHTVQHFGGLQQVIEKKKWQRVADAMHIPKAAQERVTRLYDAYCKYLVSYDLLPEEEKQKLEADVIAEHEQKLQQSAKDRDDEDSDDENGDCVIKGRSTSLSSFYRIARNTMAMWYKNEPPPEDVENDFWKIVKERRQHVVVHAGNIDSSVYGSGFPSGKSSAFAKHLWNLKVLTNNSSSILRCMGPVSGVTIPTLHVGMLFTTGCWYRDPHCLPWIEYLHTGASKIWYGIPASFYEQFRIAMNKIMPYCCTSNPIWLPSDTAMVPPSLLVEQGCSLSRVVQHSGQFIVVFPGAFTSTICCGYSVSESVYFAPPEWLDLAEQAFQAIQLSHEPPAFSLERLLFCIVNDGRTGTETLTRLLPMVTKIRDQELQLRAELNELGLKVAERLPLVECRDKKRRSRGQDEDNEQECEVCRTHCYISMVVNSQDETIYCLDHARAHVQKKKNLKFCKLMYTYNEEELNEIVQKTVQQIETHEQKNAAKKKSPKKKTP